MKNLILFYYRLDGMEVGNNQLCFLTYQYLSAEC